MPSSSSLVFNSRSFSFTISCFSLCRLCLALFCSQDLPRRRLVERNLMESNRDVFWNNTSSSMIWYEQSRMSNLLCTNPIRRPYPSYSIRLLMETSLPMDKGWSPMNRTNNHLFTKTQRSFPCILYLMRFTFTILQSRLFVRWALSELLLLSKVGQGQELLVLRRSAISL